MPERKKALRLSTKKKTAVSLERFERDGVVGMVEGGASESTEGWRPDREEEETNEFLLPKEPEEGKGEFWEPIPLDGVPKLLRAKMYEVAPMLRGRNAVYSEDFFHKVVGLCNLGCEVDKAIVETPVTAEEVAAKWKPASRDKHRFPIANCLDPEQAALFTEHFSRVYGGRPDNEAFSMKFLCACFATFVHKKDVNWAAKATQRRQARVERSAHNPRKLGPMAIREQVGGLCRLIARHARASGRNSCNTTSTNDELAAMEELRTSSERHILAEEAHTKVLERLEELTLAFTILCSEEDPLGEQWGAANFAFKSLKQQGMNAEAEEKKEEARLLLCKMKDHSDKQQAVELELKKVEAEELPALEHNWKEATDHLLAAKEKLRMARLANLHLHPKQAFSKWPADHSIPRMLPLDLQLCCNCNLGFLARSSISACCGCMFHPTCFASLLQEGQLNCPRCLSEFDGPMLAQWGYALTEKMKGEVSDMAISMDRAPITGDF